MPTLLPANFDELARDAVRSFWDTRNGTIGTTGQEGNRGAVIAGKNLDGFTNLVAEVAVHCGLPRSSVRTSKKSDLTLPGYFRPTKNWDTLVMVDGHLLAVFEFKSHVGPSFGNNFNNRIEEALGNATDLRAAQDHGTFKPMDVDPRDQVPPFVGYVMVLEDCHRSRRHIGIHSKYYDVLPEFVNSSYAERYRIFCEKLMAERLYSAAALVVTERVAGSATGKFSELSPETSLRYLFSRFAGEMMSFVDAYKPRRPELFR